MANKIMTLPHGIATYTLLSDTYYGINGFETGERLKQHKREDDDKYTKRKEICYYQNYTKTTVDSHVNPVFKKEAERDLSKVTPLFQDFMQSVDGNNTAMANFMKTAALMAKLNGFALIFADNFAEIPATQAEVYQNRVMPYAFIVQPSSIVYYIIDSQKALQEIAYTETNIDTGELQTKVWTKTEWRITEGVGDGLITKASGVHNLGAVPCIVLKSRLTNDIFPPSEFNQIAKANLNLFNKCSWEDEILSNQTFPVLTYPTKNIDNITLGTDNALGYDGEVSKFAPGFIAPPSEPAKLIRENIEKITQEIYRMAALSHVTGVENSKSGVAKQWDYETTNLVLADFAGNCEQAETQLVALYQKWTNENFEYKVIYPRNFGIIDVANELDNADKAVNLNFGTQFKIEVCKKIISAWFPKLTPEEIKAILDDVEATQLKLDEAMANNGNYINNSDDGRGVTDGAA